MKTNLKTLTTPAFIIGLVVLLLNDFVLKAQFGNWLTGKLSDFAGLFVFAVFWMAIFPRYKRPVLGSIALMFVWWKTSWSDGFIHWCFEYFNYSFTRVVDLTDLMALIVLPAAYYFVERANKVYLKLYHGWLVFPAVFAFVATSPIRPMVTFFDAPAQPVIVWEKSPDSLWLSEQPENNIVPMLSDSIEGYVTYQGWFGMVDDLKVAEFDDFLLFKVGGVPLWNEVPKRFDDFEKSKAKVRLSELVLPEFRNRVRPPDHYFLKKLDTFSIKTSCFGFPEEMSFKNSKQHGAYKQYYPEGQIRVTGNYYHGLEDGKWTVFTPNGAIEKEVFYTKGQRTREVYYINGEVHETRKFKLRKTFFLHGKIALWSTMSLGLFLGYRLALPGEREREKISKWFLFFISILLPIIIKIIQAAVPVFLLADFGDWIPGFFIQMVLFFIILLIYNLQPRSFVENIWLSGIMMCAVIVYEQWSYLKDFPEF